MKTIEQVAFGRYISDQSKPERKRMGITNYIDWAHLGADEAQRWIPIEEELPICVETGDWDGRRSDYVLVKLQDGNWSKAILYSGIMDGHIFNDWYDERDFQITETITHWRPIERN